MSNNSCSFWEEIQKEMSSTGDPFFVGFKQRDDYLRKSVGITGINYAMVAATREYSPRFPSPVRVEIVFEKDENSNRTRFNRLKVKEEEIARRFGVDGNLTWDDKLGRKKYKIIKQSPFTGRDANRKAVIRWLLENIKKLKHAAEPYLEKLD